MQSSCFLDSGFDGFVIESSNHGYFTDDIESKIFCQIQSETINLIEKPVILYGSRNCRDLNIKLQAKENHVLHFFMILRSDVQILDGFEDDSEPLINYKTTSENDLLPTYLLSSTRNAVLKLHQESLKIYINSVADKSRFNN